jgi:hypothetical protein
MINTTAAFRLNQIDTAPFLLYLCLKLDIMNIHAEKIKLIEWIARIQDFNTIEKLINIRNKEALDWWDDLSEFERNEIELGLKDVEQGNTIKHSEAKKLYEKYL